MRKFIVFLALLALAIPSTAQAAMSYGASYYQNRISYVGSGDSATDPLYLFINEVETAIEAFSIEGGVNLVVPTTGYIEMTEISDPSNPSANTIRIYVNDSGGTSVLAYRDSAGAETQLTSGSGDNTLDNAYDQGGAGSGRAIDVDSGAVTLTVSDTDNNVGLVVAQNDSTNDPTAMQITSAADAANAISLDIDAQTTGRDIEGTGASFYVEGDGSIVGVDLDVTGAAGITLQNDATITNAVDGAIALTEGGENISLTFNANTLSYSTSSAMDSIAYGVVDDLEGVGSITFDAASSAITLPTDGAAQDLLIQTTGATNSSIVIQSTGTAADALVLTTTAGGIDITNGGAAGGEDVDIDAASASLNLNADEDVADAITITASAGGMDVTIDGAAGSDLDLVCTNGSTNISGGEAIATAVTIAAGAGGVDISSAATFDIDITATGGKVIATGNENAAGAVQLLTSGGGGTSETIVVTNDQGTGEDSINIDSTAGGIDVDYATGKNMAVTGGQFIVTSNEDVASAINLVTNTGTSETIVVTNTQGTAAGAITLTATAGGVDVDAAATLDVDIAGGQVAISSKDDAASAISLTANQGTSETIVVTNTQGTGAGAITLTATAGGVDVDAAATLDVDLAGGQVLISSKDDAASAIGLTTNQGTSETITVTNTQGESADAIDLNATAGGITLEATGANGLGRCTIVSALIADGAPTAFGAADGTPDVSGHTFFTTGGADTYTDFDAGTGSLDQGQMVIVWSQHAATFDVTGTGLKGGTADLVTASGDMTMWIYDGTDWRLMFFMDMSDDLS